MWKALATGARMAAGALKLGLRLLGLLWEERTTRISRSVHTHNAGTVWGETKTGEARTIGLPESVRHAMERHPKIQAAEKLAAK